MREQALRPATAAPVARRGDPLTRALLTLTFVTGIVDAVGFIGLGQVFAAMQTGNVIFLGLGIGGTAGTPVLPPLISLAAFLVGGGAAALLVSRWGLPRERALRRAIVVEVSLLGSAALIALAVDVSPGALSAYVLIAILSLTMGLRNTLARRAGGPNLATTVLNLTLTAFTTPASPGMASGNDLAIRGAAFLAILCGAITGALLLKTSLVLPLAAATVLTLAAGLAQLRQTLPPPSRSA